MSINNSANCNIDFQFAEFNTILDIHKCANHCKALFGLKMMFGFRNTTLH